MLRLHGARRRRSLRQDGPQRHRVRRHAVHRRGLRRAHGGWPDGRPRSPTSSASGTPASSTPSSSRSRPRSSTRSTRRPGGPSSSSSSTRPSRRAPAAGPSSPPSSSGSRFRDRRGGLRPLGLRRPHRPRGSRAACSPARNAPAPSADRRAAGGRRPGRPVVVQGRRLRAGPRADPPGEREFGWGVDIATVSRIWRGGCIIRARLLKQISDEYAAGQLATLLVAPSIQAGLADRQERGGESWRSPQRPGVPVPGFSSALALLRHRPRRAAPGRTRPRPSRQLRRAHLPPGRPRGRLPHAVVGRPVRGRDLIAALVHAPTSSRPRGVG